ncbi:MAG: hypothetical protein R3D98_17100 [Candidatus Krumholzibacteriia bacterium]
MSARRTIIWALLLLLAVPAAAARFDTEDGADVRRVRWGMSPGEVRRREPGTPTIIDGSLLIFPTRVNDQPCTVSYLFHQDKLCMVFYQFSDIHEELGPYFDEVEQVKAELVAHHGEPQIDRWDWEDPLFAQDPELKAEALGLGLVRYELGWMTDRSLVAVRMSGGNLKADILVMYADVNCFPAGQEGFGDLFAAVVGLPSPYFR